MKPIEEDDSSSGFGATGVFQVRSTPGQPTPASAKPPAAGQTAPPAQSTTQSPQIPQQGLPAFGALPRTGEFPTPASGSAPVQPVVHSVVFPTQNAMPVDEGARLRQLLHDQSLTPPLAPSLAAPIVGAPMGQVSPGHPVHPVNPAPPVPPVSHGPQPSLKAEPVPNAANYPAGGFTQLLRTLEHRPQIDPPAASAVKPVAPPAPAGPYPPASFAQGPMGQSPLAPARKPEPEPGSFTSLFSALGSPEPPPAAQPPARAPIPVPPAPVARPVAPAPAGGNPAATAGSFTQLMQVLGSPDTGMLKSSPAAPVAPQQAKQAAQPIPPAAPSRPAPAPMQERFVPTVPPIAAPPPTALQPPRAPQAPVPAAAPVAQGIGGTPPAGSFTQLMQVLGTGSPMASQPSPQPATNFSSGPGSKASAPPAQGGGDLSFTQLSMGSVNSEWSASQPLDPGIGGVAPQGGGLASRPDSWPVQASAPTRAPQFGESPRSSRETPGVQAPEPPRPMGGGLTQLLRTLDKPDASVPKPAGLGSEYSGGLDAPQPAAGAPGPGIFTQTYGQLTDTPVPAAPPAPAAPALPVYRPAVSFQPGQPSSGFNSGVTTSFQSPAAPVSPSPTSAAGPSDFTKILNASQLREANLYGASPAPGAGAPPSSGTTGGQVSGAAGGMGQFQFPPMQPPQMPPVQMPPVQMQPPQMAPQFQHPQFPNPQFPSPQMPPMTGAFVQPQSPPPPPAPAAEAPAAKPPQNYLPLVLMMVIFVLVAVIVALLVTMKH